MKKVIPYKFSIIFILVCSVCFSCKKSAPEPVEKTPPQPVEREKEEPQPVEKKDEIEIKKEEKQPEKQIAEQPKKEISATQFKEIEDLIAKAKEALADIYDKENFSNAKKNLNEAKSLNSTDPEKAAKLLDLARKQAENAYYNAYKARALEKKQEADKLIADLTKDDSIKTTNKKQFDDAMSCYNDGTNFFDKENYSSSYAKYAESVDKLNDLYAILKKNTSGNRIEN